MMNTVYVFALEVLIFFYSLYFWIKFKDEADYVLGNLEKINEILYKLFMFSFHIIILTLSLHCCVLNLYGKEEECINYLQIIGFFAIMDTLFGDLK